MERDQALAPLAPQLLNRIAAHQAAQPGAVLPAGGQDDLVVVAGCDGGRSLIRKAAGIEFPGWDPTTSSLIAEVEMGEEPEWGLRRDDNKGIHSLSRVEDGERVRVLVRDQHVGHTGEPTLRDLSEALIAVYGTDYGLHSATWISRFTDMTRQAASYRDRRVLLAGDAAHVHYPVGGQGLQIGVQDAVNLGWKLAQVVKQTSPETLLDTYHAERHPVAARVLHNAMAQTALLRSDARTDALRDTMSELLAMDEPRKRIAAMMSGLDIHYDLGAGHPLLGRRMPDLDLVTANHLVRSAHCGVARRGTHGDRRTALTWAAAAQRAAVRSLPSWSSATQWASVTTVHRSRLRAVIIDVPDADLAPSVAFWAKALGRSPSRPAAEAHPYLSLLPSDEGIRVTFQRIDGPARFHLDIETDDVDAEVRRLETAGGQVVERVEDWVVLRDPAGLLLCVIPVDSRDFDEAATSWP